MINVWGYIWVMIGYSFGLFDIFEFGECKG